MKWIDNSPVFKKRKERYNMQSIETRSILDKIKDPEKYQLKVIKRTRPKLSKGDVFILNPFGEVYFYGVVLNTNIDDDTLGRNLICVCILKRYSNELGKTICIKDIEEDVLVGPCIINKSYWTNGMFYNIGINIEELNLDYGFYSIMKNCYVNEYEKELNKVPRYLTVFSLTTMTGIAYYLTYELVIDNSFLDSKSRQSFSSHIQQVISTSKPSQKILSEFDKLIAPFVFEKEHSRRYSVALTDLEKTRYIFSDIQEDAEGNGYDWEAVMKLFIKDKFKEERKRIKFDSEAEMFYMYCSDGNLLKKIITALIAELNKNNLREYTEQVDFVNN